MKKISNSSLLAIITRLLVLLVVAKFIMVGLWWYLPSDSIELKTKNNFIQAYKRIDFSNMIKKDKVKEVVKPKVVSTDVSITSMLLKGLYGSKKKGYIIVAMKRKPKSTSIIGIGEVFQGYTLKSILKQSAVFTRGGKNFVLEFKKMKKGSYIKPVRRSNKNKMKAVPSIPNRVSKKDISDYSKDPSKIWREISISEVKEGKKIKGFKINRIKAGSKFAVLGLRQGDLIIKANNVRLESYRDAMNIYKNINKLDAIEIVVLRNNQEVELVYEIN